MRKLFENAIVRTMSTTFGGDLDLAIYNSFSILNCDKFLSNQTYVFLMSGDLKPVKTESGLEYSYRPYFESGKPKSNPFLGKALTALKVLEEERLRNPGKSITNSPEFSELSINYKEASKNYPNLKRQFTHHLERSEGYKIDNTMESFYAIENTKYLGNLDEKNFAVDHRLH